MILLYEMSWNVPPSSNEFPNRGNPKLGLDHDFMLGDLAHFRTMLNIRVCQYLKYVLAILFLLLVIGYLSVDVRVYS
jgi:hypothetical protein